MKKGILLIGAALLCGSYMDAAQYSVGDYVYTPNGRFLISGENLVTNGDFSDAFNGWLNYADGALSADSFSIATDGPDGGTALMTISSPGVLTSNYATSSNFHQIVQLEKNTTYICTYSVKAGSTPRICSTHLSGSRCDNHQSFYISSTNTQLPTADEDADYALVEDQIFDPSTIDGEWTERNMDYSADSSVYVVISFYNLIDYDEYTDFGIYEAVEVGDDRAAQDLVDEIDFFLGLESFNAGDDSRSILEEAREELESYIGTDISSSDINDIVEAIEGEDGPLQEFLEANSADLSGYYTNFTFDGLSAVGKSIPSGWSAPSAYRWGISTSESNLSTSHAYAEIPCDYDLESSYLYQVTDLPAGTYLYAMRVMARKYLRDDDGKYCSDYVATVDSLCCFVNDDTVYFEDVETGYAKLYFNVFEVSEDGDQTVGFRYPTIPESSTADYDGYSGGGRVVFDNIMLRSVGTTSDDVDVYFYGQLLASAQESLQSVIDSAYALIESDRYLYGKDSLQVPLDIAEEMLATYTSPTQNDIDSVEEAQDILEDGLDEFHTINYEYVTLGDDIETCEENVADEAREDGKDEFQAAIDVAKTFYEAQTVEYRDSAGLVETDSVLMAARQVYMLLNASQTTPGEVNIVNNSFQRGDCYGWEEDGITVKAYWQYDTDNSDFTDGSCIFYLRGKSATDSKYVYQDIEIDRAGVYYYTTEAICNNSSWTDTAGHDTETYIYLNNDSVMVITEGLGDGSQDYPGGVEQFTVTVKIADINDLETPGVVRIGLEREYKSQALGIIYYGSNHLYYLGSIEDYDEDLAGIKEVTADTGETATSGDVYTIGGVKVRSGANSLEGLDRGVYIMNGKKYVVK